MHLSCFLTFLGIMEIREIGILLQFVTSHQKKVFFQCQLCHLFRHQGFSCSSVGLDWYFKYILKICNLDFGIKMIDRTDARGRSKNSA